MFPRLQSFLDGMGGLPAPRLTAAGVCAVGGGMDKTTHFEELRARVAALRGREGLPPVRWTEPVLTPGATTVRLAHLAELRSVACTRRGNSCSQLT